MQLSEKSAVIGLTGAAAGLAGAPEAAVEADRGQANVMATSSRLAMRKCVEGTGIGGKTARA